MLILGTFVKYQELVGHNYFVIGIDLEQILIVFVVTIAEVFGIFCLGGIHL